MSTITRELAKLFRKITNSEIDAEGNAHVVLSPADSLLINNARIALASLEAEPVAWAHRLINKRNGVVHPWVYGSAEACPSEGDIFNIEVMPLYTAPPAPVSVPDEMEMDDDFDSAFEHGKAVGWNAYRAAMLQGVENAETPTAMQTAPALDSSPKIAESPTGINQGKSEPVTTANKLPFEQWLSQQTGTIDVECGCVMTEVFFHWLRVAYEAGNSPVIPDGWVLVPVEPTPDMRDAYYQAQEEYEEVDGLWSPDHQWKAMLAAAPQQEA
ncbi:DUF551 domain-containing protein [Enterobacter asburiae]|uniref:DUF551 domain-containing protein n=1 Tax=Enterobacter asburiae TaxID=61645 RepID=UPI0021C6B4F4|nr:DUF551 domain-containing protein [Enterobacter asburiae]MCU3137276.1 DUF551 domain-containing protein [Enterobacter asburiae]